MKQPKLRNPEIHNFIMRFSKSEHDKSLNNFNQEMLHQLEVVRQWGPTITHRLVGAEKEIFEDILLDIQILLDSIELKVFKNANYL